MNSDIKKEYIFNKEHFIMRKRIFVLLCLTAVSCMMFTGCANSSKDSSSGGLVVSVPDASTEGGDTDLPTDNSSVAEEDGFYSRQNWQPGLGMKESLLRCIFMTMTQRRR